MSGGKSRERDVVLFLGAGFSADAGLPTMAQFGAESDRNVLSWADKEGYEKATQLLRPAKQAFDDFRRWCLRAKRFCDVDLGNVEDLFCIIEALEEAGDEEIDLCPVDGPKKASELRKQMALWLWKIFQQCPPATEAGDRLRVPYRLFIGMIKSRNAIAASGSVVSSPSTSSAIQIRATWRATFTASSALVAATRRRLASTSSPRAQRRLAC